MNISFSANYLEKIMKKLILLSILASAFSASAFATPNLVANASFEDYALPAGTTTDVSAATAGIYLPSWSIVGPENVQLVTSTYASPPYNLSASDGVQWVDLTGMTAWFGMSFGITRGQSGKCPFNFRETICRWP